MVDIVVGSNTYFSYLSIADADDYLLAAVHGATWQALSDDDAKARALITATRTIDRQEWKGTKTSDSQAGDWPRDSVGVDGVTDGVTPQDVLDATAEIALALVDGSELQNEATIEQRVQNLKAGSVSLTFFRGIDGTQQRFPQIIMELLRKYLVGFGDDINAPCSSGTSGSSSTGKNYGYNDGL